MNQDNRTADSFEYSYSSRQQEEIETIRRKYAPAENTQDKMELLRRLDRQTTQKGTILALCVGIIGALLLGLGMSCVLVWMGKMFIPGILIGLVGIAGIIAAYPLYMHITQREREKVSPQILQLVKELSE